MSHEFILCGKRVVVCPLNQLNVKEYLSIYKKASIFSKAYEMMPDFWENRRECIEDYIAREKGNKERYLIAEKETLQGYGYMELDYSNPDRPEVDIAILEEYRRNGYASEAARVLFQNIFEREEIKSIIWNAFSSNEASCRIAEKLGGTIIERKNLIMDAMSAAGLDAEMLNGEKMPRTVTYEIKKDVWG